MNYRKLEIVKAAIARLPLEADEVIYLLMPGKEVILGKDGCQPSNSICLLTHEEQIEVEDGNSDSLSCEDSIRNVLYGIDLYAIAYKFSPSPEGLKYVCETEDSFDDECAISYWDRTEAEAEAEALGENYFIATI
jgi:hypothetical protein